MLTLLLARPCSSAPKMWRGPCSLGCLYALWSPTDTETGIRERRLQKRTFALFRHMHGPLCCLMLYVIFGIGLYLVYLYEQWSPHSTEGRSMLSVYSLTYPLLQSGWAKAFTWHLLTWTYLNLCISLSKVRIINVDLLFDASLDWVENQITVTLYDWCLVSVKVSTIIICW
jgi:hypothetical protein